ncbi:MAG: hypothetical protein HY560_09130 [Gemmatimonadetes bacterium]|nr:hypothetical protein [Gemmatimonadota bacterium]
MLPESLQKIWLQGTLIAGRQVRLDVVGLAHPGTLCIFCFWDWIFRAPGMPGADTLPADPGGEPT